MLTIQAILNKDLSTVWDTYTNPDHIIHWNFASPDWSCPYAKNDLTIGGQYLARMEAKDGSFGFDFEGIYDDVIPHQFLSFTLPDARKIRIFFQKKEEYLTEIKIYFDPENIHPHDFQVLGWQSILNNFKSYSESQ